MSSVLSVPLTFYTDGSISFTYGLQETKYARPQGQVRGRSYQPPCADRCKAAIWFRGVGVPARLMTCKCSSASATTTTATASGCDGRRIRLHAAAWLCAHSHPPCIHVVSGHTPHAQEKYLPDPANVEKEVSYKVTAGTYTATWLFRVNYLAGDSLQSHAYLRWLRFVGVTSGGAYECKPCQPGSGSPLPAQMTCTNCTVGTYNDAVGVRVVHRAVSNAFVSVGSPAW